jgi:hypothetical protein
MSGAQAEPMKACGTKITGIICVSLPKTDLAMMNQTHEQEDKSLGGVS